MKILAALQDHDDALFSSQWEEHHPPDWALPKPLILLHGEEATWVPLKQSGIGDDGERVERLLGVVYVRNGFLGVTGNGVAAEDSAWTVVVAKEVRLSGQASIRINADYDGSDVPVPEGVGPNAGGMAPNGTRLVE